MKFKVRFKIGNHYGAASIYSLSQFCIFIVDQYGLTEGEITHILHLKLGEEFECEVLKIERIK